ncbi:DNA repair protein [Nadsonia fulvescens var. elongata DSM 6958]|uniref:DNA repair protein RAD14 n=1 Tax=Nadsonia fulvescens var. elongata DSM 6958 TaxID=857566 RepID=A0A1E3PJV9_9ASCO|nr:DNA repair protein [Nadsonia fulvescens var. elongata DSM 6958]
MENSSGNSRIQPAKKFKKYIDYDFSKMTDTKGGFIADEVNSANGQTLDEWKLKQLDTGPSDNPQCFECNSRDIDLKLFQAFKCRVCKICREKLPEKYSLLTKTECRADYLLTDPELRDEELLPHMERPNPHQSTYSNMMLYLRYQVEEYAFKKWDGEQGLDAEYERRMDVKKKRRDKKFLEKLKLMRKKTRAQTLTRKNGDDGPHIHDWSTETLSNGGMIRRRCVLCGMETEEISF